MEVIVSLLCPFSWKSWGYRPAKSGGGGLTSVTVWRLPSMNVMKDKNFLTGLILAIVFVALVVLVIWWSYPWDLG